MVEFVQKIDNRTLSCPAQSDQSRNLIGLDNHRNLMQRFYTIRVFKVDVLYLYFSPKRSRNISATLLMGIIGLQDIEKAFGIDEGVIDLVVNPVQLPNRCRDVIE